jgi:Kdo2-lipid IVA lauroyltransferase/acyltransferase
MEGSRWTSRPAAVRHFTFIASMTGLGYGLEGTLGVCVGKREWKRRLGRLCSCRVEPSHPPESWTRVRALDTLSGPAKTEIWRAEDGAVCVLQWRILMRRRLEYAAVWPFVKILGILPRSLSRAVAIAISQLVYLLHFKLRRVGMRNLEMVFPEKSVAERKRILRGEFTSLGRQLAELCQFPKYTLENVDDVVVYDGLENYQSAYARGKGVLFLTAHFGGWELSAFVHSLHGHPVNIVMRPMDNQYLDRMLQNQRTLHGNKVVPKDDFVRGLLAAMKTGQTVGILMDTNMTPPQGIFVDFFGIPACTASGLARIALRTDAAVVPGFTIWDQNSGKYRLRFDPALELTRTGNLEADIAANTQVFTKVIENYVREYPDQWLWVHRRWKTRPEGEKALY